MLVGKLLCPLIQSGRLVVIDADGGVHHYGTDDTRPVIMRLHDRSLHWRLFFRPDLYAGEAYTNGTLTIEGNGDIYDFLDLFCRNAALATRHPFDGIVNRVDKLFRRIHQFNPATRARRNVAHHYNLTPELYELFLDSDRQYSCAYFLNPDDDIETAQEQKRRHIAAKLCLQPGMKVLDVGCGWGGLALYLGEKLRARVTGITLAQEQLTVARARARERGLDPRVHFDLRDYRDEQDTYDRVVSVGMFEHVGIGYYDRFFRMIHDRLSETGVALLHTIGRADGPGGTNAWIRKYIFPGGYIPALSEIVRPIERAGLVITDVEILRLHYAETLRRWRERFLANRKQIQALTDERFCRMWEFYLAGSEVAFRHMHQVVFQIQLAKRIDAAPIVRDYIHESERHLARLEHRHGERAA